RAAASASTTTAAWLRRRRESPAVSSLRGREDLPVRPGERPRLPCVSITASAGPKWPRTGYPFDLVMGSPSTHLDLTTSPSTGHLVPGRRICVVGTSGSGKTYVARELARRLSLTYICNDAIIWRAGWQPT